MLLDHLVFLGLYLFKLVLYLAEGILEATIGRTVADAIRKPGDDRKTND